jgi:uncharacterized Ntn-hydrolase superfamily protein
MLGGEEGALVISDVVLGRGVIHTQARWSPENQRAARERMEMGDSPDEIINWLRTHDDELDGKTIDDRQYGIVEVVDGHPQATAFTGADNPSVAGHLTGSNYSIQGNILLSREVLEDMEEAFLSTSGPLSERLMATMEAAKRVGADSRCAKHGVSSLSAFLRVARETDDDASYGKLSVDINVSSTPEGIDPIDELRIRYETLMREVASDP